MTNTKKKYVRATRASGFVLTTVAAALLAACGGGGSDTATPSVSTTPLATTTPPASNTPAITVTSMTPNTLSAADCARLQSDSQSEAALDLTNPNIKAIHDLLLTVDPVHAYKVFIRRPNDFVNWVVADSTGASTVDTQSQGATSGSGTVDVGTLGTATHETLHMVDDALWACTPVNQYKIQYYGSQLVTSVGVPGSTPGYSIVDQVIDPSLKSDFRYAGYITKSASIPGNDFAMLLDELAAYSGAANTELQYAKAGGTLSGGYPSLNGNLGGTVNFMVWLEYYLMAARQSYPTAYSAIKNSPATVAAIQTLWSHAETVLQASYPQTKLTATPKFLYDSAYFTAAYSTPLLAELDSIGVTHASAASWSGTYLP